MAAPVQTTSDRTVTRREGKALTRSRLLKAALHILDEEGEAALTTTTVTRRAGIAQSSFYVHFADMDDLLHCLIDDLDLERLRLTRVARQKLRSAPIDEERLRDTFRVPVLQSISHPRLFRLLHKSRHDRSTPLGEWSRSMLDHNRKALVEDLITAGAAACTAADRRKLEMVADGVLSLTESLTLGHLEGRYPQIDEVLDVLVAFSWGYFPMLWPDLGHHSAVDPKPCGP